MQAIWSRAAQGLPCGCRSCGRIPSNIVARRTAATAGRLRARVGLADIFTACYATILGAAAVVDAKLKDDRSRDLDEQIADAKAELAQLIERRVDYDPNHEENECYAQKARQERALGDHLAQICISPDRLRKCGRIAMVRRQFVTRHLRDSPTVGRIMAAAAAATAASPNDNSTNYEEIFQRLLQEEQDSGHVSRECKTDIQLEATRDEAWLLAESLLSTVCTMEDDTTSTPGQEQEQEQNMKQELDNRNERLDAIMADITKIRQERYPHFKFAILHPEESRASRTQLNQATRKILRNSARDGPYETVAKISYNILVTPFPLSIHNYNALLFGFTRLGWYGLAEVVAESLYRTKLARTKQTIVCLLHHYRLKNDIIGFYTVIAELVAVLPGGAMVRRKRRGDMGIQALSQWAAYSDTVAHPLHVTERMPRDASILEAIIQGTLHFGQLGHGIHVFSNALYQGCKLRLESVQRLLDACLASFDREAAMSLIRIFTKGFKNIKNMGVLEMKNLSEKMYALLAMVGLSPNMGPATEGLSVIGIHPPGFRLLSLSLRVNATSRKVARVERDTLKLMKIFSLIPSHLVSKQKLSSFYHIAEVYARRFDSEAGEWCEDEYDHLRIHGALIEAIHQASQTTHQLIREFQYILPRLLETGKNRRRAYGLVYWHDPIGLLYSKMAVRECIYMMRQEVAPTPAATSVVMAEEEDKENEEGGYAEYGPTAAVGAC